MSKGTLGQVVKRAISDAAFRRQLQSDPGGALKGFDLSEDERSALRSGDAGKLSALGVDQRMSKAFSLGESTAAASRSVSSSDVSRAASVPDGGEPLISEGLISGSGRDANQALISNPGARTNATEAGGGAYTSPLRDPDNTGGAQTAREFNPAAGNTSMRDGHDAVRGSASETGEAAYRSPLRDPDNTGGASGSNSVAPIEGSPEQTVADLAGAGGASAASSVRDPDNAAWSGANTGGSAGSAAAIEGSPEQTSAELREIGAASGGSAMRDAHDSVTPVAARGEGTLSGDQHGVREAVAGSNQTEGTAFLSSDEAGRNVVAGDTAVSGNAARGGDAFLTADEMGRDITEGGGNVASQYPDAAAERAALEASQQGDTDMARGNPDDFGGKPEITA